MPNTTPNSPKKSMTQFGSWFKKRKQDKLKQNIYENKNRQSNLMEYIQKMHSTYSAVAEKAVEEIFKEIDFYLEEYKNTGDTKYQKEAQDLLDKTCIYARNAGGSKGSKKYENDTCNTIAKQINKRLIDASKNSHDWESLDIDLHGAFFSENVALENIKSAGNINLNGCTFQKGLNLKLAHSKIGENDYFTHDPISLSNCTFGGDLNIHGGSYSIVEEINLKDNTFTNGGKLDIGGLSAVENGRLPITIEGDSMPHDILFTSVISPTIQIGSDDKDNFKKTEIPGGIVIKNCENADFNIYNHTVNGSLQFIPEDKVSTYRTDTAGNIRLKSCEIKETMILGTSFKNARYEKIKNIEIVNSTIHKGIHTNTQEIEIVTFNHVDFLIAGKYLKNINDARNADFFNSTKIEFYNISKIGTLELQHIKFYAPVRIESLEIENFCLSSVKFYQIKPQITWKNSSNKPNMSCKSCTLTHFDFNTGNINSHEVNINELKDGYKLTS